MDPKMTIVTQTIIALLVILILSWIWKALGGVKIPGFPEGPKGWPIVGNAFLMATTNHHLVLTKLVDRYGPLFGLRLGSKPAIVISSLDLLQEALVKKANDFAGRPQYMVNFNILSRNGQDVAFADYTPTHKFHRKLAISAMKFLGTDHWEAIVTEQAKRLEEKFAARKGQPFDPSDDIAVMVFNTMTALNIGKVYKDDDPEFVKFQTCNKAIFDTLGQGNPADFLPILTYLPNAAHKKMRWATKGVQDFIDQKVMEHKETFDQSHLRDVIDALFNARNVAEEEAKGNQLEMMTDENICLIMLDNLNAGVDTMISSLKWSLMYMLNFPEVKVKMREEISRVVDSDTLPCWRNKSELPYNEAAMWEMLRLSCVAPLGMPHTTTCDTELAGKKIPKGTMVITNLYAVQHDEKAFPEPEVFRPERNLDKDGNLIAVGDMGFIPFSLGRRSCMGHGFSKMVLFVVISRLLKKFKFEVPRGDPNPSMDGDLTLVLSPKPFKIIAKAE